MGRVASFPGRVLGGIGLRVGGWVGGEQGSLVPHTKLGRKLSIFKGKELVVATPG